MTSNEINLLLAQVLTGDAGLGDLESVPAFAIEALPPRMKLAFNEIMIDAQVHGKADVNRIISKANGEGESRQRLFEGLLARAAGVAAPRPATIIVEKKEAAPVAAEAEQTGGASIEFPENVMSGVAGAFAEIYSKVLEPSPQFFYSAFLVCLGVLTTGNLTIASEIAPPTRFYMLLLGESADDRKSTAIKKTLEFFRRFVTEFSVCWGVGSAEGLQAVMEKENRLLLALDEMKMFVSKCKIEGSVLLSCVTSLFENTFYHSRTKTSAVKLENVHLSILAASTIGTFETMFGSMFIDIGFLNRLWLVPGAGSRRFSIPGKIPEVDLQTLGLMLGNVLKLAAEVKEMPITTEARALFDKWYLALPQSVHSKRLDVYALRLMPLLAINDSKREVDAETVRKVIALCDHQYQVRMLYDPIDADSKVAAVEEKIRRTLRARGALSDRDLKRAVHVERIGLWVFQTAYANLSRAKEVGYDKKEAKFFLQPRGANQ